MTTRNRMSWYDRGADAVARVWPEVGRAYRCPICWKLIRPENVDTLTREHAPAGSLGGTRVTLTCAECNRKGSTAERHASSREKLLDFVTGELEEPIWATYEVFGHTQNVLVHSPMLLVGEKDHNPPGTGETIMRAMDELIEQDATDGFRCRITPHIRRFDERLATLAYVRAAYLILFARFGYRYVRRPVFELVRQQLQEPSASILPPLTVGMRDAPRDTRAIVIIREPDSLRGLGVWMAKRLVILPAPRDDMTFYERLPTGKTELALTMTVEKYWPCGPAFAVDLSRKGADPYLRNSRLPPNVVS